MLAVEIDNIHKSYGDTKALDGLSLTMPQGSVLGVLGPNGAGKTTTVKVLTTLITPDRGSALVDGIDVVADPDKVRVRVYACQSTHKTLTSLRQYGRSAVFAARR